MPKLSGLITDLQSKVTKTAIGISIVIGCPLVSAEQSEVDQIEMPDAATPVVLVTSTRHSKDEALINDYVTMEDIATAPSSVTELLVGEPGIAANGQPGLFQTLNIRGLARQRVHAYINGMRITSERRAGVAASFVDPLLLSGAEVTQGPASTYYGSGAIGGTIHLNTRQADHLWVNSGYRSDGNEWVTALGIGDEDYALSFAYRSRENGETVTGETKNNHYDQRSVNFVRHFRFGDYNLDWQIIESRGDDIGKDNSRFPDSRITSYPEESHLLSQLTLSRDDDWLARLYFHDQSLVTEDTRPGSRINTVTTDSLDIGLSYERTWGYEDWQGLLGFDYFGRRGVSSDETELDLESQVADSFSALSNGDEDETALFATVNRDFESWSIHAGARANYQSQKSELSESVDDSFSTYFVKGRKELGDWSFDLSYGTGFRFATLSERLFSGTTGRGQTIGNPDLLPEESRSLDLGALFRSDRINLELHWFNTDIKNFIERVRIDDDTRTYQNVTNGELDGWQYQFDVIISDSFSLVFDGQGIRGVDSQNNWLADVPAKRLSIQLNYQADDWRTQLDFTLRESKEKFGDGEIALQAADIVNFRFDYQLNPDWRFKFVVENLLDETYFNSADDLSTLATGRSFGISVAYQ